MWQLYKIVNFFYILVSSYFWIAFLLPGTIIPVAVSAFMIICFALGNFEVKITKRTYAIFAVVMLNTLYSVYILGMSYGLLVFFSYFPPILLFVLNPERQENLLKSISLWMSWLMGISIFVFGLHFVIEIPNFTFLPPQLAVSYSPFKNYIFFLTNEMYGLVTSDLVRFSGPYLEPGHQSMVCALLLFANRFQMKSMPWLWVLVLSIFISFSLAGYVILIVGFCLVKIKNLNSVIAIGVLAFAGWFSVAFLWNGGDNPVNTLIFERLEYDEQKGIKGNNRTVVQTDFFFRQCVEDGSIWLGVHDLKEGNRKIRGAGYKIFILKYGIVGLLLVAWLYLLYIPKNANKRYAISFFLLMSFIFLQRAYPMWYSWLFSYVVGIGVMRNRNFNGASLYEDEDNLKPALGKSVSNRE